MSTTSSGPLASGPIDFGPLNPERGEPRALSAFEQAEVDRLYWDDSDGCIAVRDIAARFDLPDGRVHRFVTPWQSDVTCLLCGAVAVCTSRSQRSSGRDLTCGGCGAPVWSPDRRFGSSWGGAMPPNISADVAAVEVDPVPVAHVLIRRRLGQRLRDLGNDANRAVSALHQAGRPFSRERTALVLDPHDGIEEIQNLLARHPVTTLGVASLRTLGDSQAEAMQNLLLLTGDGWRVVSATDTQAWFRDAGDAWDDGESEWPCSEPARSGWNGGWGGGWGAGWDAGRSDGWGGPDDRCDARDDDRDGRIIDATHRFSSRW